MFAEVERERNQQIIDHFNCWDGVSDAEKEHMLREASREEENQIQDQFEYEQYEAEMSMSQPYYNQMPSSVNQYQQQYGGNNTNFNGRNNHNKNRRGTFMDIER